jgi:flagellar hook-associated protein 3 FlgL
VTGVQTCALPIFNLAAAAVELGEMDLAHKAALQTTARIVPQTLLDFLR